MRKIFGNIFLFCACVMVFAVLISGCDAIFGVQSNGVRAVLAGAENDWTVVIYMAADNDLEAEAIADIKELESVNMRGSDCNVLVLLDRSEGYDYTAGDWTGTKLLKISYDKSGIAKSFVSTEIDCPELDIYAGKSVELNMASGDTLKKLLQFVARQYKSRHYALVIWGHGTGWRGGALENSTATCKSSAQMSGLYRAFAFDDEAGSYMTTEELANALLPLVSVRQSPIDVIAFDTCFASMIECAYEFSGKAKWLLASEGVTPSRGWDYARLFETFLASEKTSENFCDSVLRQYTEQYRNEKFATISQVDLNLVPEVVEKFDVFSSSVAETISDKTSRDEAYKTLFDETRSYSYSIYPCDMYLDIYDMAGKFIESDDNAVKESAKNVRTSLRNCVVRSWSGDGNDDPRLGVHFIELVGYKNPKTKHDMSYVYDGREVQQNKFVYDCKGWVPSNDTINSSLLDKLFYVSF